MRSKTKQNRQTLSLCSRLPTPDSLLPTPDSLLPTPDSLLPTPYSLLPTPYSLAVKTSLATKQSFHKFITRERPQIFNPFSCTNKPNR
ncbi:hypothetical protein [Moorena sp. SIO3A2]|uniref:hypothetical protein n=1 Tax=Moorena sp. SIO3A2 TaxID=2607841 RepID=UPI0013BC64BF|nr:hypothetical protein [Moorena sp. SIO3A2]NER89659.1 hypothetical protein [Moorena sp. SIO3A2]